MTRKDADMRGHRNQPDSGESSEDGPCAELVAERTDVGLSEETSALRRGRRRGRVLDLRRRRRARGAHAVGSVHDDSLVLVSGC